MLSRAADMSRDAAGRDPLLERGGGEAEPEPIAYSRAEARRTAEILERGLKERAETAGLGLLGPAVEAAMKREVGRMSDRLAHLLARAALESASTRRLVFQILARQLTAEDARRLNQAAWTSSVDSLRKPAEGLREILGPRANPKESP
jgi:hypothetical protein